jgi:TolA-binding protein
MRTTTALLALLALTLPAVAMPHPCEAEVAQMRKDLDAIRGAVATIEGLRPSDNQRQVLAGAKSKYDLEQQRTKEAQARCEKLVRAENPGARAAAAPAPESAPAVSAAEAPAAPCLTGCGKDTDCKGARICVNGACQDPPSR